VALSSRGGQSIDEPPRIFFGKPNARHHPNFSPLAPDQFHIATMKYRKAER
jgi:hypothetical protein